MTINRYTRAGAGGRLIACPRCSGQTRVFHFSWSALKCQTCGEFSSKNEFKLLPKGSDHGQI